MHSIHVSVICIKIIFMFFILKYFNPYGIIIWEYVHQIIVY
jgi:hypothetical protein